MAYQRHEVVIPFDDASAWTLHIIRENNSSHIEFELHWRDKDEPTHATQVSVEFFEKAMRNLMDTTNERE